MNLDKAKTFAKTNFPAFVDRGKRMRNALYVRQKPNIQFVNYHGIQLAVPSDHKLLELLTEQPNREGGLRVSAERIFNRHPTSIYVDVGANIGDTAAVVRSVSTCEMVLIEPSEVFFPLLATNTLQFGPGVTSLQAFFTSPADADAAFSLIHSAGTAQPHRDGARTLGSKQQNLGLDQLPPDIGLLKIDTDGYDAELIGTYTEQLALRGVNLFFEMEVRTPGDVAQWVDRIRGLFVAGYAGLLVWDDPGHFLCSISGVELARQLLQWQLSYTGADYRGEMRVYNFDVLAVAANDREILSEIKRDYAQR